MMKHDRVMSDRLFKTRFAAIWVRITLVAFVAAVSAVSIAQTSSAGVPPHELWQSVGSGEYLPILSDFDGDHRLDQAELHLAGAHHCIRVRFGNFRETHLDFGTRSHSGGVLLVRDVNSDDKPDLVWTNRFSLESILVWVNDGAGHFAEGSNEDNANAAKALFAETDYTLIATFGDQEICLAALRPPFDFVAAAILDHDACKILITDFFSRPACKLDLSSLRERGPPVLARFCSATRALS
jgi:hypothetical protein